MDRSKRSKHQNTKSTASLGFDESIRRLPTEYESEIYWDRAVSNDKGEYCKELSILTRDSKKVFYSDLCSMGESDLPKDRLTTDKFRDTRLRKNNMAQETYKEHLPRVEYVDLNGRPLDSEKLRNSNMLPGQSSVVASPGYTSSRPVYSQSVSPPLQPVNDDCYVPSPQPYMPAYTLEEPYPQRNYREQLDYADNIGQDIQERYAVLPSEFIPVKTVLIPISPSRRQSLYEPQSNQQANYDIHSKSQEYDVYNGTTELPSSYRVVERRGRTLVRDLLLDPITGTPAPLQIVEG